MVILFNSGKYGDAKSAAAALAGLEIEMIKRAKDKIVASFLKKFIDRCYPLV